MNKPWKKQSVTFNLRYHTISCFLWFSSITLFFAFSVSKLPIYRSKKNMLTGIHVVFAIPGWHFGVNLTAFTVEQFPTVVILLLLLALLKRSY